MTQDKQCQILDCAIKVFARFGFKKTSVDDIAKAADISRQGVYLHFRNKDEIFQSAVTKYIRDRSEAANEALSANRPLTEKILQSLDEWFGTSVGLHQSEAADLAEQFNRLVGDHYTQMTAAMKLTVSKCIRSESDPKLDKKLSDEITEVLFACGKTWKQEAASREEFQKKLRSAIRICFTQS